MLETNKYPYTDFHELNLDWIIAEIRKLHTEWSDFKILNQIRFDGQWDITKQYPAWTLVNDNNNGYISKKPVPAGIALDNTEYWGLVADYSSLLANMQNRIIHLEHNTLDWINAIDYGFKIDEINDDIMDRFIANNSSDVLYFPKGEYLFSKGFNFPTELHIVMHDNATLKLVNIANPIDYFITVRRGSNSGYTFTSFIRGGCIDCNYMANIALGFHQIRGSIIDGLYIKNIAVCGIETNTYTRVEGAATYKNIIIENTRDIEESEATGTIGIRDNGLDNVFNDIEIINTERGIYTINGSFSNVKCWIRSKNLIPNSSGITCDGKGIQLNNITIDTYRKGLYNRSANGNINISNMNFIANPSVYTPELRASNPLTIFDSTVGSVYFRVNNLYIDIPDNITFETTQYEHSSYRNVYTAISASSVSNYRNDTINIAVLNKHTDAFGQCNIGSALANNILSATIENVDNSIAFKKGTSGAIRCCSLDEGSGALRAIANADVVVKITYRSV